MQWSRDSTATTTAITTTTTRLHIQPRLAGDPSPVLLQLVTGQRYPSPRPVAGGGDYRADAADDDAALPP